MNAPVRIAVIIPFRNEWADLQHWKHQIPDDQSKEIHFYFVDDHSDDSGAQFIRELNLSNVSVIELSANQSGKKAAIASGVHSSESEFILTLDADVQLPLNYFESVLKSLNSTMDLTILPVAMTCNASVLGIYQYTEWQLMQALTKFSFDVNFPMMCNGANLLFSRSFFLQVSQRHYSISSGDDLFMLIEAVKSKVSIDLKWETNLSVQTHMMNTWNAALSQRLRWAGKSIKYPNSKLNLAFALFAIWQLLSMAGVIYSFFSFEFSYYFLIAIFFESLFIACIQRKFYDWRMLVFQPLLVAIYPFISLSIFITSLLIRPKWKGREVSLL